MMEPQAKPTAALDDSQETITRPEAKGDAGIVKLSTEVQVSNLDTMETSSDMLSKISKDQGVEARPKSSSHHEDQRAQVGSLSEGEGQRKRSIEPHEAIRRGLSFGPLRKNGGRHNSTSGILKTSSKSPSSRLSQSQRSLSSSSDILASAGVGRLKKDRYVDSPNEGAAIESSDEDPQSWSSGDEASGSGKARGRKRDIEDGERTASTNQRAASGSEQPAVIVTGPDGERPVSTSKRFIVRPNTNYDRNVSRGPSPSTSDSECVSPQPIISLFKPDGSPEKFSRNSRAPAESMVLIWTNTTGKSTTFAELKNSISILLQSTARSPIESFRRSSEVIMHRCREKLKRGQGDYGRTLLLRI